MPKAVEKYCCYCGALHQAPFNKWPKTCVCGVLSYRNPLPVVNALLPVRTEIGVGILCIRRDIEPCRGQWALPGGYLELDETWQEGAVRELYEETGIRLCSAEDICIMHVDSNPKRDRLLLFGLCGEQGSAVLDHLQTNDEVSGFKLVYEPQELAFLPHTCALGMFFNRG